MNDFTTRKELLDPALVHQLSQRSNQPAVVRLSVHLFTIGVGALLIWKSTASWQLLPVWMVYGTALVFLFAPLHECTHKTAFRNRWLNEVVATVSGFLLFLPANYFRAFHLTHHRYTNDPNRDPELLVAKPTNFPQYAWSMSGLGSYWWPQIRSMVQHARGSVHENFISKTERELIVCEARCHLIAYGMLLFISILFQTTFLFYYWLIPAMFGMVALRLFLLAEHTGCETSNNMLSNTRTTLTHPIVRLLAWNMPYHGEHHLYPAVPFHQLPTLHQHLQHHLSVVAHGYQKFHQNFLRTIKPD